MRGVDQVFWIITTILLVLWCFNTSYEAIKLYNCVECSAPWHTALLIPWLVYVFFLAIVLILYFTIKHSNKD